MKHYCVYYYFKASLKGYQRTSENLPDVVKLQSACMILHELVHAFPIFV